MFRSWNEAIQIESRSLKYDHSFAFVEDFILFAGDWFSFCEH